MRYARDSGAARPSRGSGVPAWVWSTGLALLSAQVFFSVVNVATWQDGVAVSVVDLNTEANVTTWWSSMLLVGMAVAAAGLWLHGRLVGRADWSWALLALAFVALSLEEVAGIHERLGYYLEVSGGVQDWPLLYLPALAAGAWLLLRALRDLRPPRRTLALAGLACFICVVGAELVSIWSVRGGGMISLGETLFEENSEMAGHALILLALSWELAERVATLELRVRRSPETGLGGDASWAVAREDRYAGELAGVGGPGRAPAHPDDD